MHHKRVSKTPRVNMDADERTKPQATRERNPPYLRRKTGSYCKKRKGPHSFVRETEKRYEYTVTERDLSLTYHWFETERLRCTACGKMKRHYNSGVY